MTLLVISPDYASHLLPLATLASAWRDRGDRVVVATGPATASVVESFDYERTGLRLGRGSNPGVIRPEQQERGEDDALRGFFVATRGGMVDTLLYQADARRSDLLWQPVATAHAVLRVVDAVRPDHIIVDHLAFSARLALTAGGVPHGDVVLGHPSALPVGTEVYGFPPAWPACFAPDVNELTTLHDRCREVAQRFTAAWNSALTELNPDASPADDAFAERGDLLLFNYPEDLHDPDRTKLLPRHTFLGSAVRSEGAGDDVRRWLDSGDPRPVVYVSFGSFLSARDDVLARVVDALRTLDVRVALAIGSADRTILTALPSDWLVREFLPQVALLEHAAVAITHGGNNSITEALTQGVPMVLLPFSTDQFAGAAAIERAGLGEALDPNVATPADLAAAVVRVLAGDAPKFAEPLGERLRSTPGSETAWAAMTA